MARAYRDPIPRLRAKRLEFMPRPARLHVLRVEVNLLLAHPYDSRLAFAVLEQVYFHVHADAIVREEIAKAGLEKAPDQYFAVLTDTRTVGVMGDARTYGYKVLQICEPDPDWTTKIIDEAERIRKLEEGK